MLTPQKFKYAIYVLHYLEGHRFPSGFFIKQTAQVINILMLCYLCPTLIDLELIIPGTVFTRKKYGLRLIIPKMNAQFVVDKPVTKFIKFCIVSRSLAWKTRHVSSAYNSSSQLIAPDMSLTYKRNKRGPRIEPWGTPHSSFPGSEKLFSTLTRNVLLVRYDLNPIIVWAENCR